VWACCNAKDDSESLNKQHHAAQERFCGRFEIVFADEETVKDFTAR
jgi:hypothetical protein